MSTFSIGQGGRYDKKGETNSIGADNKKIKESKLRNLGILTFKDREKRCGGDDRLKGFDPENIEGLLKIIEAEHKKSDGELWEMYQAHLFNKALRDEFIIVRTSEHDDLHNGIDTIIVRTKDGKLVGSVDELCYDEEEWMNRMMYNEDDVDNRREKKEEKIIRKMRKGIRVKYGLTMENGKLVKGEIKDIPIFCLHLEPSVLKEALEELCKKGYEKQPELTELQKKIMSAMLDSMRDQAKVLQKNAVANDAKAEVMQSLAEFETGFYIDMKDKLNKQ